MRERMPESGRLAAEVKNESTGASGGLIVSEIETQVLPVGFEELTGLCFGIRGRIAHTVEPVCQARR